MIEKSQTTKVRTLIKQSFFLFLVVSASFLYGCGDSQTPGDYTKARLPIPSLDEGIQIQAAVAEGHQPWRLDPKQVVLGYQQELGIKEEVMAGDLLLVKDDSLLSIVEVNSPKSKYKRRVYLVRLLATPQNPYTIWFVVGLQNILKPKT